MYVILNCLIKEYELVAIGKLFSNNIKRPLNFSTATS